MSPSLPQPVGRQKEVLVLPPQGHAVVLGTAGSGKTTLAIHRALYLARPDTDHCGRTLLVTFNRCLVSHLRALARAIPMKLVVVENYHRFARGYLSHRGKMSRDCICRPDLQRELCRQALIEATAGDASPAVLSRPIDFLVQEFDFLAQHGIKSEAEYVDAERIGRAGTRIVRADRPVVFGVYQRYLELRRSRGKSYDWQDLSHTVLDEFNVDKGDRTYRHVVIDEGQDFSPMMLRSLAAAIPPDGSLTLFGDMAQQIYGNRMSWRSAGLRVKGVWEFEENYRNTRQVAQLALAMAEMPNFPDDADLVEPKAPTADGPLPALVSFHSEEKEDRFAVQQAVRLGKTGTVAVLFRDREQEKAWVSLLPKPATRLHRDLSHWPTSSTGIFHGTYHSAKGLEFDAVILPHLSQARLPHPPDVTAFGKQEAAARDLRLLYVAVTRAKLTLILTHSANQTDLLPTGVNLYTRSRQ